MECYTTALRPVPESHSASRGGGLATTPRFSTRLVLPGILGPYYVLLTRRYDNAAPVACLSKVVSIKMRDIQLQFFDYTFQ
jgi:hypothetical protein